MNIHKKKIKLKTDNKIIKQCDTISAHKHTPPYS